MTTEQRTKIEKMKVEIAAEIAEIQLLTARIESSMIDTIKH